MEKKNYFVDYKVLHNLFEITQVALPEQKAKPLP